MRARGRSCLCCCDVCHIFRRLNARPDRWRTYACLRRRITARSGVQRRRSTSQRGAARSRPPAQLRRESHSVTAQCHSHSHSHSHTRAPSRSPSQSPSPLRRAMQCSVCNVTDWGWTLIRTGGAPAYAHIPLPLLCGTTGRHVRRTTYDLRQGPGIVYLSVSARRVAHRSWPMAHVMHRTVGCHVCQRALCQCMCSSNVCQQSAAMPM